MPLIETRGAASAQGFGEFAQSAAPVYIEDVFSTYLYDGNGSTQTITNGIDLSGKGGLVWLKGRSGATDHALYDTARGATKDLVSNSTSAETTQSTGLTAFSETGFSLGALAKLNTNAATYASWTFRKQKKFFDVVTYTGNGSNRTISHNLGSVPGCIIVKRTDTTADWQVYHRSLANTEYLVLNSTAAKATGTTRWNSTTPTSTVFSLGTDTTVNASGGTYVAYLYAHNAGGFGLSGTRNVIVCGSYTGNGSADGPLVNLAYEPQWILIKDTTTANDWQLLDSMRGLVVGGADAELNPNNSNAESSGTFVSPRANEFRINTTAADYNANGSTYIYIAIRRGPMKVPTSGTSVFSPVARTGTSAQYSITAGFAPDTIWLAGRSAAKGALFFDRLRGLPQYLAPNSTGVEGTNSGYITQMGNTGYISGADTYMNTSGQTFVDWIFRRAPGFFDVVCYTGIGTATTVAHYLGVAPEMMIVKRRDTTAADWWVYDAATGNTKYQVLNSTATPTTSSTAWNNTTPTSIVFTVGSASAVNFNTGTYVAYLFATLAGVSKVGSYTGTGTTKQIDCGFTAGARFVLIKRTDSTGDWYVWDTARGIVAGNDPYLLLNSTAAEVTSTDYIDSYSAGFELSSTAPAALNANGGTYIFLAIA